MREEKNPILDIVESQLLKDNVVYLTNDMFITDNIQHIPPLEKQIHIDMSIYVICKEGEMRVTINGQECQIYKNGVLICTGLHIVSSAFVSPDFKCSIVGISHSKLVELMPNDKHTLNHFLCIKENPIVQLNDNEVRLLKLYKDIFDEKCNVYKSQFDNLIIDKLLYAVIYELIQIYSRYSSAIIEHSTVMPGGLSYGQKFLALLAEDKCCHRKVEYFAEKLCITPRYLSAVCLKETGKTPSEWICEQVVGYIRHYLLNTTLSVKEICSALDFPNSSFLCKFTKKHLGMPPLEYRQNGTQLAEDTKKLLTDNNVV